jgi:hypothetical protein
LNLPPFQLAVGRFGWRQAGRQLPPDDTAVSLSLPPFEAAVGAVFFIFYFFFFIFFFF